MDEMTENPNPHELAEAAAQAVLQLRLLERAVETLRLEVVRYLEVAGLANVLQSRAGAAPDAAHQIVPDSHPGGAAYAALPDDSPYAG